MCDTVYLSASARECRTPADLRDAGFDVRRDDVDTPVIGWAGSCFCVVDVEAILDRANADYTYDIERGWIVT
jgi:hypothetical protein